MLRKGRQRKEKWPEDILLRKVFFMVKGERIKEGIGRPVRETGRSSGELCPWDSKGRIKTEETASIL